MKKLIILALSVVVGCSCGSSEIQEVKVKQGRDKYLSCKELKHEIMVVEFEIREKRAQMDVSPVYANNPSCILHAITQLERGLNKAENRLDYLRTLSRYKECK